MNPAFTFPALAKLSASTNLRSTASKPPSSRTPPPPNHAKPLQRLTAGLAAALLTLTLTPQPPPPAHAQTLAAPADVPDVANLTSEQRKSLKQQSLHNTRAAGKTAQLFSTARRHAEGGELEAALGEYSDIIAAAPTFAPAYSNRGNIYVTQKMYDLALADYTTCLSLAPLDGDAWVVFVNRGATKATTGDSVGALEDMNQAYALKGGNEIVLSNRAGVYETVGKWENAARDYQAALKSNDVRPFWLRYGLVLFQRNNVNEAVAILKRVANRFDVGDVHAALAVIYFDQGNLGEAETEWSKVERPRLFESRAFLLGDRKWPPRAVDAMDRFRQLKE